MAGHLAREARWGMTPMGLCAAVLCVGDAGRRGLVTAKRVTCSPQGEDNVPYRFVRCRLCVGDYGRSRTPVPTDLCVASLCVFPPNGAAFRERCSGTMPFLPNKTATRERCRDGRPRPSVLYIADGDGFVRIIRRCALYALPFCVKAFGRGCGGDPFGKRVPPPKKLPFSRALTVETSHSPRTQRGRRGPRRARRWS